MPEHDCTTYEDETTIAYISFQIYQVQRVDPTVFVLIPVLLITASEIKYLKEFSVIRDINISQ